MTEEQTTQAGEGAAQTDNQSLLAPEATVTEVKAEPEIPHRELTDEEKAAQAPEEDEKLERPDFWPENFWSDADGPDVEALAKSYNELRTKFSQGQHKAPKDGNYNLDPFKAANVPDDDPVLVSYLATAKELGLSQDAFEKIAKSYLDNVSGAMEQMQVNREAELKKLGNKADEIIKANNQWLGKLGRTILNDAELNAVAQASTSAAFVSALNKIRQASGEMAIPTSGMTEDQGVSKDDLYAMVGDPRYGKDMAFTRKVEKMFAQAIPG